MQVIIYEAGAFFDLPEKEWNAREKDLVDSGFRSIINWYFHVQEDGSIYNQGQITQGGKFVGKADWGTRLKDLKSKIMGSSLYFSLSDVGSNTFVNITNLIKNGDIAKLQSNFQALKENMDVDGIDLDWENSIDFDIVNKFSAMLAGLGYAVSFCPYYDLPDWIASFYWLQKYANLTVTFNLQCYSGGAGNTPYACAQLFKYPMEAVGIIFPGLATSANQGMDPKEVEATLESYNATLKQNGLTYLQGAFIWKDPGFPPYSLKEYGDAVITALVKA